MADWEEDNFLAEFLCGTDNLDLETCCNVGYLTTPPDPLIVHDDNLSSYLSGEALEICNTSTSSTVASADLQELGIQMETNGNESFAIGNCNISGDTKNGSIRDMNAGTPQVIVLTRPSHSNPKPDQKKGNSDSKQAIAARENREKKKQYVSGLESEVSILKEEKATLLSQNSEQKRQIEKLKQEVVYLKSLIANDTALSKVLCSVLDNASNMEGINNISSSFFRNTVKSIDKEPQASHGQNLTTVHKRRLSNPQVESSSENGVTTDDGTGRKRVKHAACEDIIRRQVAKKNPSHQTVHAYSTRSKTVETQCTDTNREKLKDASSTSKDFVIPVHTDTGTSGSNCNTFTNTNSPVVTLTDMPVVSNNTVTVKPKLTGNYSLSITNRSEGGSKAGVALGRVMYVKMSPQGEILSLNQLGGISPSDHAYSKN